ncbi:cellulase family glycosylhydrolase, partial [Streptomyces sp. NPDC050698]
MRRRTRVKNAWRAVAERFAGNDTVVAYDLMNEPWGGSLQ